MLSALELILHIKLDRVLNNRLHCKLIIRDQITLTRCCTGRSWFLTINNEEIDCATVTAYLVNSLQILPNLLPFALDWNWIFTFNTWEFQITKLYRAQSSII